MRETRVESDCRWKEFFYDSLIPYYHYLPVSVNTRDGLLRVIDFARAHDDEMRRIGQR